MMDVRAIHNDSDLDWAVREIERYFESPPPMNTPEADRFDVLATLIEAYESKTIPIPTADPIDIIKYAIDDMGRSQAELASLLGSRSRASEVLARIRPLTIDMIRKISTAWHLPPGLLVTDYRLAVPKKKRAKTKRKAAVRNSAKQKVAA